MRFTALAPSEQQLSETLSDIRLGRSEEERRRSLAKAERIGMFLNLLSLPVSLWAFLYPFPYDPAIWCTIALPIVSLLAAARFPGVYRFDGPTQTMHLAIVLPWGLCSATLAYRASTDWNFAVPGEWLPPTLFIGLLFLALIALLFRDVRSQPERFLGALLACCMYGFGASVAINGLLDQSEPILHRAKVLEKRIDSNRHARCYATFAPWGPLRQSEELELPRSTYEAITVGQDATVQVRSGALGIDWYAILGAGRP